MYFSYKKSDVSFAKLFKRFRKNEPIDRSIDRDIMHYKNIKYFYRFLQIYIYRATAVYFWRLN